MLPLTNSAPSRSVAVHSKASLIASAAISLVVLVTIIPSPLQASSSYLYGDPSFSFGTSSPDVGSMALAIQSSLGVPIEITNLRDENPNFPPLIGDSSVAPFYVFGPASGGVIKNLNLNSPVVSGITSGSLQSGGFEADVCGNFAELYLLRVFSGTMFYDVLVRPASCSGTDNVVWSFSQISSPRSVTPSPTSSPTPFPVQLVSTASRFTHGSAGIFDLNLPLAGPPGIECRRTEGAAGDYTIVYTFLLPLNSVYSASLTGGVGHIHDSGIGLDPRQYIVNLTNVTNAQTIVVTLNFVQDNVGNVSNSVNARMTILVGDTTDNGNVGKADVRQVQNQIGQPVTVANFREDVNHDGVIDANDVNLVKRQKGTSLVTPGTR